MKKLLLLAPFLLTGCGTNIGGGISLPSNFKWTPPTEDQLWNCTCLLYTSPSPRDVEESRMPSSA